MMNFREIQLIPGWLNRRFAAKWKIHPNGIWSSHVVWASSIFQKVQKCIPVISAKYALWRKSQYLGNDIFHKQRILSRTAHWPGFILTLFHSTLAKLSSALRGTVAVLLSSWHSYIHTYVIHITGATPIPTLGWVHPTWGVVYIQGGYIPTTWSSCVFMAINPEEE